MALNSRRQLEKENLRQEILDAARELFVAEGFDSVSMRKIADRIGYSPTTIYLYFKDKSELLQEICESTFAKLSKQIEKSWTTTEDPLERLRLGLLSYIDFGLENPHHYDLVLISPKEMHLADLAIEFEDSMGRKAFDLLIKSVVECLEAGVIRQADVALTAQTLWAGLHGVTALLITHPGFPFVEKEMLIDSVVDTMIRGLRP